MKLFQNERVRRVLRPVVALIGMLAAMWHGSHTLSTWSQSRQWAEKDPPLAAYFWGAFQTELGVTLVSLFAGVVAWHLFRPRQRSSSE
jgi:hypothetical protein